MAAASPKPRRALSPKRRTPTPKRRTPTPKGRSTPQRRPSRPASKALATKADSWVQLFLLSVKVSRPYFWLVTLWLYLLPTGQQAELAATAPFWAGLLYCLYPMNLIVYGMNDVKDTAGDARNPRKGNALFGTAEHASRLWRLVPLAGLVNAPFLAYFALHLGVAYTAVWFGAVVLVNWLYNFGPRFSSFYAPMDLVCPLGYMLVLPLSASLNELGPLPWRNYVHTVLFVVRSQLWLQTFDIESDTLAGRRTTSIRLGLGKARALLALVLAAELAFVVQCFASFDLRAFSLGSCLLLAAQTALDRGGVQASASQIRLTLLVLGAGGVGLLAATWVTGAFGASGSSGRCEAPLF